MIKPLSINPNETLTLFITSPILGATPEIYIKNKTFIDSIHSFWICCALRGGILSILILILIIARTFFISLKIIRNEEFRSESLTISSFIITMLITLSFYPAYLSNVLWIMLGITTSLSCITVQEPANKLSLM